MTLLQANDNRPELVLSLFDEPKESCPDLRRYVFRTLDCTHEGSMNISERMKQTPDLKLK